MDYSKLNDIIKSSKNILIISHINPDGDTLGSMCGLYSAILDNCKKKCDMMSISKVPDVYSYLPHLHDVKNIEDFDKSREYDLVINVDVASIDRIMDAKILFEKAKFTVNIDHHKTNNAYGDLNFVNPDASSTGEVLFGCFNQMGWNINLDTAICLYTAILTDTGSFRFDNTKPSTFDAAAKLVEIGVQPSDIYKKVYESDSKTLVMFQAHCISKAKFLDNDKIAYTIVYKKDMEKFSDELTILLLPKDPNDDKSVIIEIRGGAGGEEAALFANSLYRMYSMYAESKGWKQEILNAHPTELGGYKEISFSIEGEGAYSRLKYESGVHRVQRVPETESQGRIHTSTVTVAVLALSLIHI